MQDKGFPFNLVLTYVWLFLKPFSLPPPFPTQFSFNNAIFQVMPLNLTV